MDSVNTWSEAVAGTMRLPGETALRRQCSPSLLGDRLPDRRVEIEHARRIELA